MKKTLVFCFIFLLILCSCEINYDNTIVETEEAINNIQTTTFVEPTPIPTATIENVANEISTCDMDVFEASWHGIEGEYNGWGYKKEYGYYIVNNTYTGQFMTLWIELEDYSLSPLEEHAPNGMIVYPVNEIWTDSDGNIWVPLYCNFRENAELGLEHKEHENGIYYLLYYSGSNGRYYLDYYPCE